MQTKTYKELFIDHLNYLLRYGNPRDQFQRLHCGLGSINGWGQIVIHPTEPDHTITYMFLFHPSSPDNIQVRVSVTNRVKDRELFTVIIDLDEDEKVLVRAFYAWIIDSSLNPPSDSNDKPVSPDNLANGASVLTADKGSDSIIMPIVAAGILGFIIFGFMMILGVFIDFMIEPQQSIYNSIEHIHDERRVAMWTYWTIISIFTGVAGMAVESTKSK